MTYLTRNVNVRVLHSVTPTQCDYYTVWLLHSLTATQCFCYSMWQLHGVIVTPCGIYVVLIPHSVIAMQCDSYKVYHTAICGRRNKLTVWFKICEYRNCLRVPDFLCWVTYIVGWRVVTPLKFHMQFLVYIKRYSEFYVPYFLSVLVGTLFSYPA